MNCTSCKRALDGWLILALCAAAALLTACAGQPQPAQRVNQAGYSAAFRQGYADGCDSAQSSRRRDESRYQNETDYMMGWNDGRSACSKRK